MYYYYTHVMTKTHLGSSEHFRHAEIPESRSSVIAIFHHKNTAKMSSLRKIYPTNTAQPIMYETTTIQQRVALTTWYYKVEPIITTEQTATKKEEE